MELYAYNVELYVYNSSDMHITHNHINVTISWHIFPLFTKDIKPLIVRETGKEALTVMKAHWKKAADGFFR